MKANARKPITIPQDSSDVRYAILAVFSGHPITNYPSPIRLKQEYVLAVLQQTKGNVSEASRKLRMPRRSIQRIKDKHIVR